MHLTSILGRSMRTAAHVLVPSLYFLCLNSHAANPAPTASPASIEFPSGQGFGMASSGFDFYASGSPFGDDCGDPILSFDNSAATARSDADDTIVLARLDTEKTTTKRAASTSAGRSAAASKATAAAAAAADGAASTARAAAAPVAPVWEIVVSDKTLNAALARWAATAGWQLLWELPVDYAVEARTAVPGSFEEAVSTVAKSMETAEIPMKAIFYQGNKVLRITAKGGE